MIPPVSTSQGLLKKLSVHLMSTYTQINDKSYSKILASYQPIENPESTHQGVFARVVKSKTLPEAVIKLQSPHKHKNSKISSAAAHKEARLLIQLSKAHVPHIPRLFSYFASPGRRYGLVMENGGPNLHELFLKNPYLKQIQLDEIETISKKILEALASLHARNIAHFDLKPENCSTNYLFDFNISEQLPSEGIRGTVKCTRFYRPPEVVLQIPFGIKGDLWSLGCVLYELYTSQVLFPIPDIEENELQADINLLRAHLERLELTQLPSHMTRLSEKSPLFDLSPWGERKLKRSTTAPLEPLMRGLKRARRPIDTSDRFDAFAKLLLELLETDPKKRISAQEALNHPFFTSPSSFDLSFKIQILGEKNFAVRILNSRGKQLETIDLSKWHPGSCYHIEKSPTYRVELFHPKKPEEKLAVADLSISNGQTLTIGIHEHKRHLEEDTNPSSCKKALHFSDSKE